MPNILEMTGIVRHFGDTRANDGIDLSVAPGVSWAYSVRTAPAKAR